MPPSRWKIGKNRAGRRETERGKHSDWEKRKVEGRTSNARKKRRRRRTIRRAAQKLRTVARAKSSADAGCDVIRLQQMRRDGHSAFKAAGFVEFAREQTQGSTRRRGTTRKA